MENNRSFTQLLGITLRGIAMGSADVIPGVSGGTIAFITGIYEELITSISNINLKALKKWKKEGFVSFWKHINGNFFVALVLGIGISILSLARLVTFLLESYPVLLWAFFIGLIIASIPIMMREINKWGILTILGLVIGTAIAAYISTVHVVASGGSLWYILLCGAIAICAMILPGISGAFILVLMGAYTTVLTGLKEFDLTLIGVFILGCVVGILSFSHLLKYLFSHYKNFVLALLSGFLIGSLLKVWPWKNPILDGPVIIHSDGTKEWMMENVLPADFIGEPQVISAILLAIVGFLVVFLLDWSGRYFEKKKHESQ